MSDSAKRISDGSFKNTIKMTLTTEGHLGVGNIDPKFKVTAEGLVQGHSTISILPLVSGVGLTGKGMHIGLGTWNGDVHTLIGQVTSDGSNNGCIQVTAGGASGGIGFGGTAYGLSLQPSGGNVGVGMTQATSRLQVNGNIRTDVDFVTGTDTPGWTRQPIPGSDFYGGSSGSWSNTNIYSYSNDWDNANMYWKVIGKTVFLSFNITNFNNNRLGAAQAFALKIPANLQNIRNALTPAQIPLGGYSGLHHGVEGLAMYRNAAGGQVVECTIRKGSGAVPNASTPWTNTWYMLVSPLVGGSQFINSGATESRRGTSVFELN